MEMGYEKRGRDRMKGWYLPELSWKEVEGLKGRSLAVLIPLGSLEQHGTHLPLGVDSAVAFGIAKAVAEELPSLLLPPLHYGTSYEHLAYPGTISIPPSALIKLLKGVCSSIAKHGLGVPALINGHGGNLGALQLLLRSLHEKLGIRAYLFDVQGMARSEASEKGIIEREGWHADELETSLYMCLKGKVSLSGEGNSRLPPGLTWSSPYRGILAPWRSDELSPTGALGDPSKASLEKGERLIDAIVKRIVATLREATACSQG